MPTVSCVVVTYNGGARVLHCIDACKAQRRAFDEIIVVDNASQDGSPAAIRAAHPDVRLIELTENRGPCASRNVALSIATGEYVFWIDNDLFPDPDCLQRLLDGLAAESADVILPRIILVPETDTVQAEGGEAHFIGVLVLRNGFTPLSKITHNHRAVVGAFPSGCICMNLQVARDVGGFDESYFFYFEDYEFSFRTSIFGYRMIADPAAIVWHDRGAGTAGLAFRGDGAYPRRRAYLLMRNRLRVICTHYSARSLIVLAPVLLFYEAVSLGMAVVRGWTGAWWEAWGWLYAHRSEVRSRRRWVQARRRRADREILRGGPVPLAPGLLRSTALRWVAAGVSTVLNVYWKMAKRLI